MKGQRLTDAAFGVLFSQLPPVLQTQIAKYRKWEDGQRSLLSKILLMEGLKCVGLTALSLSQLRFTDLRRPYFNQGPHFNISHSGDYVVCAISQSTRIGIDIEEIVDIPLRGFETQFSQREWEDVLQAPDRLYAFYKLWTQKEAFVKGMGEGLHVPLNGIVIEKDTISFQGQSWFLQEISLHPGYICHLSVSDVLQQLAVEQIEVDTLLAGKVY